MSQRTGADHGQSHNDPLALDAQSLRQMVLSVIRNEQDYDVLLALLEPVTRTGKTLSQELTVELALLVHDVEQQAALNDQLYSLISEEVSPSLVLNEAGIILAQNQAAAETYVTVVGDNHLRLGISTDDFRAFQHRMFVNKGPTLLRTVADKSTLPLLMTATYFAPYRVFMLQSLACRWPDSVDLALEDLFGLTRSERDILACLAQGMTAEDISALRHRSLGTLRQQIKSLMRKTGASRQNQIVSLGAALANRTGGRLSPHHQPHLMSPYPLELGEFVRDHRLVGWRRYGPMSGDAVILLHGPFFGAGDFERDRELAHGHGLNIIIPERPGYGRTQAVKTGEDPVDVQVKDCLHLMNELGIARAYLMSHESGLIPALALATSYPERFGGLLAVSPSGHFRNNQHQALIPRQQRTLLWAAKHSQWLLRVAIRLGMVQVRKLGPERWYEAVFADAPHELSVLNAESSRQGTLGAYSYNYSQNGAGLELDLQQTMTDWDEMVAKMTLPFDGMLGHRNQTTPPEFVRNLQQLHDSLLLHEFPDAGQALSVSHAEEVFALLAKRVRASATPAAPAIEQIRGEGDLTEYL